MTAKVRLFDTDDWKSLSSDVRDLLTAELSTLRSSTRPTEGEIDKLSDEFVSLWRVAQSGRSDAKPDAAHIRAHIELLLAWQDLEVRQRVRRVLQGVADLGLKLVRAGNAA